MKPTLAILKHDIENYADCYRFEIHFEKEIKTLIINLNKNINKAYFVDTVQDSQNLFQSD